MAGPQAHIPFRMLDTECACPDRAVYMKSTTIPTGPKLNLDRGARHTNAGRSLPNECFYRCRRTGNVHYWRPNVLCLIVQ